MVYFEIFTYRFLVTFFLFSSLRTFKSIFQKWLDACLQLPSLMVLLPVERVQKKGPNFSEELLSLKLIPWFDRLLSAEMAAKENRMLQLFYSLGLFFQFSTSRRIHCSSYKLRGRGSVLDPYTQLFACSKVFRKSCPKPVVL